MLVVVNGKTCLSPELRTLDELLRFLSPAGPFAVARKKSLFREEPIENALSPRETGSISFTPRREVGMNGPQMEDQLTLYGRSFSSRLLLGTARYDSPSLLADAISAADPAMLTVSLRRQISASKESG